MSRATPDRPCRKESYGYGAVTLAAGVFHRLFSLYLPCVTGVHYPAAALTAPVWARPCSIASTGGFTVVFSSSGYLDVSVHRVRSYDKVPRLPRGGSPHSDIHGSKPVCGSPWLFAAYRVFRRFLKPRHPPSALDYFLYSFTRTSSSVRDCSVSRVKDLLSLAACVSSFHAASCRTSWRITESNR